MSIHKSYFLIFIITTIIFLFFYYGFGFFNYGDIGLAFLANDMMLLKAKDSGTLFNHLLDTTPDWYAFSLKQHTFNYSLTVAINHLFSKLLSFSAYNIAFISIVTYFLTIFVAFFLGKEIKGKLFGFIFAFLYATDIYFNVNIRTGSGIYTFVNLLLLSCFLFFMLMHNPKYRRPHRILFFSISSFIFALCFFNGYPLTFVIFPIIIIFILLINLYKILGWSTDENLERKLLSPSPYWVYALYLLSGLSGYVILSLLWDTYLGVESFTCFNEALKHNFARKANAILPVEEYLFRIKLILYKLFVDMDRNGIFALGGTHSDTSYQGKSIIPFFMTPFFIIAFVSLFWNKQFWSVYSSLLFLMFYYVLVEHFSPYAPRVWVPMSFFCLLLSSIGILISYRYIEKYKPLFNMKMLTIIFCLIVLSLSIKDIYYFTNKLSGNKIFNNGQPEILRFIEKNTIAKKNLIIIVGDKNVYNWISNIYLGNGRNVDTVFSSDVPRSYEKVMLEGYIRDYAKVYLLTQSNYIPIGNPGKNYINLTSNNYESIISQIYPNWLPIKTITVSGAAAHYIFDVKKCFKESYLHAQHEKKGMCSFRVNNNSDQNHHELSRIHFQGELDKIEIIGKKSWKKELNFTRNMKGWISGKSSFITFNPFNMEKKSNVVEIYGMKFGQKGRHRYYELSNSNGHITFKFEFPYNLREVEVKTNPRIFNDYYSKNKYSVSYSIDGKYFKQISQVKSNGNERYGRQSLPASGGDSGDPNWPGKNEYVTFNKFNLQSNIIYIKLSFYSHSYFNRNSSIFFDSNSTQFKFKLDGEPYLIHQTIFDGDMVSLQKKENSPLEVSFISDQPIIVDKENRNMKLLGQGFEEWGHIRSNQLPLEPIGWSLGANGKYERSLKYRTGTSSLKMNPCDNGLSCITNIFDGNIIDNIRRLSRKRVYYTSYLFSEMKGSSRLRITEIFKDASIKEHYSPFNSLVGEWEKLSVAVDISPKIADLQLSVLNSDKDFSAVWVDDTECNLEANLSTLSLVPIEDGITSIDLYEKRRGSIDLRISDESKIKKKYRVMEIDFHGEIASLGIKHKEKKHQFDFGFSKDMFGKVGALNSQVTFIPSCEKFSANLDDHKGMKLINLGGSFYGPIQKKGFLVYKVKFPYLIHELNLKVQPSKFGIDSRKNSFTISYSKNGKEFHQALNYLNSSNGETDSLASKPKKNTEEKEEKISRNIKLDCDTVFIKVAYQNIRRFPQVLNKLFEPNFIVLDFILSGDQHLSSLFLSENDIVNVEKREDSPIKISFNTDKIIDIEENRKRINLEGGSFEKWNQNNSTSLLKPIGWLMAENGIFRRVSNSKTGKYAIKMTPVGSYCVYTNKVLPSDLFKSYYNQVPFRAEMSALIWSEEKGIAKIRLTEVYKDGSTKEHYSKFNDDILIWENLTKEIELREFLKLSELHISVLNCGDTTKSIIVDDVKLNILSATKKIRLKDPEVKESTR